MTKLKNQIVTKLKNSNCDKTQTQIVTKLEKSKKSNCDKTQTQIVAVVIVTVVTVAVVTVVRVTSFSKIHLTSRQPLMFSVQLFAILAMFNL